MNDLRTWDAWHSTHQPFELGWWREHVENNCSDAAFLPMWAEFRKFIEPRGRVLDVGCGPRPPFPPCRVVEPLAHSYLDLPEVDPAWWRDVVLYAVPAEERIEALVGACDTVICWNAIDHAIGWKDILANLAAYVAPGGHVALSTDFWPPFDGHPGFDREEFFAEVDKLFITCVRRDKQEMDVIWREVALILQVKS